MLFFTNFQYYLHSQGIDRRNLIKYIHDIFCTGIRTHITVDISWRSHYFSGSSYSRHCGELLQTLKSLYHCGFQFLIRIWMFEKISSNVSAHFYLTMHLLPSMPYSGQFRLNNGEFINNRITSHIPELYYIPDRQTFRHFPHENVLFQTGITDNASTRAT